MSKSTWKILRWKNQPAEKGEPIPLVCECGHEAGLSCGPLIGANLIAILQGNGMIFDPPGFIPPENWLPTEIQCRKCGCRLVSKTEVEEIDETEDQYVR